MATVDVDIVVTDLTFPANLKDAYCKFRPLISVRYRDSDDKVIYAREALPGLGARDYWECEKDNKKKPNYVRHDKDPKVDMDKLDITQREITFSGLDVKTFERVEVEIFDIDIKTGLEKIGQELLKRLPPDVLDQVNKQLNKQLDKNLKLKTIKDAVEKAGGKKVGDLEKSLIDKALGIEDGAARSIWKRSQDLTNPPQETLTIKGPGTQGTGNYSVTLKIEVS